ncbi:MAG: class I SAM-dependent methyltransferase [Ginsengibacter sp.]
MIDNTKRFSDRVDDYIQYRPHHPYEVIEVLETAFGLNSSFTIADIGSGTGISSELFLKNNNVVFVVEPNKELRAAAEKINAACKTFVSIDGTAESTGLDEHSIDMIFCGQSFHWFDTTTCKKEFGRILKDDGHIVLAWNVRREADDFQKGYEKTLLENIDEYKNVTHRNITVKEIEPFFNPKKLYIKTVSNFQDFNLDGLIGRLQSSSYCPKEDVPYQRLMSAIEKLFDQYNINGKIKFEYDTLIYWC